jgi:hypothetical protein
MSMPMTREEWFAVGSPVNLLLYLHENKLISERKARLFGVACARRAWAWMVNEPNRHAIEIAEQYADSRCGKKVLKAALLDLSGRTGPATPATFDADAIAIAQQVCVSRRRCRLDSLTVSMVGRTCALMYAAGGHGVGPELCALSELVRCVFSPPGFCWTKSPVLAWRDGLIPKLAQAAYDGRTLPDGHLKPDRLKILADSLEDTGCEETELLGHLRARGHCHVRGCWAVDILTGRQ